MPYKQRCTETVIMIKMSNGKCKALRALLDSGCTKTIILNNLLNKATESTCLLTNRSNTKLMEGTSLLHLLLTSSLTLLNLTCIEIGLLNMKYKLMVFNRDPKQSMISL